MKTRTIILLIVCTAILFGLLCIYGLLMMKTSVEHSKHRIDSVQHEKNYQNFVDSLTRERSKKQLEDYLKKHPSERPPKK